MLCLRGWEGYIQESGAQVGNVACGERGEKGGEGGSDGDTPKAASPGYA